MSNLDMNLYNSRKFPPKRQSPWTLSQRIDIVKNELTNSVNTIKADIKKTSDELSVGNNVIPIRFSVIVRGSVPHGNLVDVINAGSPGILFVNPNNSDELLELKSNQIFVNVADNYKLCYYAVVPNEFGPYSNTILTIPDGYYYIIGFQNNYTYENGITLLKYRPDKSERNSRKIYRIEDGIPTGYAPQGLYLGKFENFEKIVRVLDSYGSSDGASPGVYSILLDETGENRRFGFVLNNEEYSEKNGSFHYIPLCGIRIRGVTGDDEDIQRVQLKQPHPYWELSDIDGTSTRVPNGSTLHLANLDDLYTLPESINNINIINKKKRIINKKSIINTKYGTLIKNNKSWTFTHNHLDKTSMKNLTSFGVKWSDLYSGLTVSSLNSIVTRKLNTRALLTTGGQSYYVSAEIVGFACQPIMATQPNDNDNILDIIPVAVAQTINYMDSNTGVYVDDLAAVDFAECSNFFATDWTGNYPTISRKVTGKLKPLLQNQDDANTAMYKAQYVMGTANVRTYGANVEVLASFSTMRGEYVRGFRTGKYNVINTIKYPAYPTIDSNKNQAYQFITNPGFQGVYTIPIGEPFVAQSNMITFESDSPVTVNGVTSDGFLKVVLDDNGTSGTDTIQASIVLLDVDSSISTTDIGSVSGSATASYTAPKYFYIPIGEAFRASFTENPKVQLFTYGGSASISTGGSGSHWTEYDFVLCSYGNQVSNTLDTSTATYTSPKTGYVMPVGANVIAASSPKRTINGGSSAISVTGFTGQLITLTKGYSYRVYMRIMCQSAAIAKMSCTNSRVVLKTDDNRETLAGPFSSPDVNRRASYNYPKYIYYPVGDPFTVSDHGNEYSLTTTGGTCHVHEGSGSDYAEFSFILASFGNQTPGVVDKPASGSVYYGASGKLIDTTTYVNVIAESSPRRTISGRDQQPVTGFNDTRVILEYGKTYQMYMRCMCQTDDYVSFGWQTGKAVYSTYNKVVGSTPLTQRAERNPSEYRFVHAYPDQTATMVDIGRKYSLGIRLYCNSDDGIKIAYTPLTLKQYDLGSDKYDVTRIYGFTTSPMTKPQGRRQLTYTSPVITANSDTTTFILSFTGAIDLLGGSGTDYIIPIFELYDETDQVVKFSGFTLQGESGQMAFYDQKSIEEEWKNTGGGTIDWDDLERGQWDGEIGAVIQRRGSYVPFALTPNIGYVSSIIGGHKHTLRLYLDIRTDDEFQIKFDSFTVTQLSSLTNPYYPGIQIRYNFTSNHKYKTGNTKHLIPHVIPPGAIIAETDYVPLTQELPFEFTTPRGFYDQCPTQINIVIKGKQSGGIGAYVDEFKVTDYDVEIKEPKSSAALIAMFNLLTAFFQIQYPFKQGTWNSPYAGNVTDATNHLNDYFKYIQDNKPAYTLNNGLPGYQKLYKADYSEIIGTTPPAS